MQITIKLLLVLTNPPPPPDVSPESAFISWLRRRTEQPTIFTGMILRGTKGVKQTNKQKTLSMLVFSSPYPTKFWERTCSQMSRVSGRGPQLIINPNFKGVSILTEIQGYRQYCPIFLYEG